MKKKSNLKFIITYAIVNSIYLFIYFFSVYMTYLSFINGNGYLPNFMLSIIFSLIAMQFICHTDKVLSLIGVDGELKVKPITYALFLDEDYNFSLTVFVLFIPICFNVEKLITYIVNAALKYK